MRRQTLGWMGVAVGVAVLAVFVGRTMVERVEASGGTAGAGQVVEYYCPMHPNVVKSEPGMCPVCGMSLVKRVKTATPPAATKPAPTCEENLAAAVKAIDATKQAIAAGDTKSALAELDKAKAAMAALQAQCAPKSGGTCCPMM